MDLTKALNLQLKRHAHALKPVLIVGEKGLHEGFHEEFDRALNDHELIKIKLASRDRAIRTQWRMELAEQHGAFCFQVIGATACFYRKAPAGEGRRSVLTPPPR